MSDERLQLKAQLAQVRERRDDLQSKIDEVRILLAKADARRAAESPDQRSRWDAKLNTLETNYDELKRAFGRAKMDTERLQHELAELSERAEVSLDEMVEEDIAVEQAAAPVVEQGASFSGQGLFRVITTPLERLTRLDADSIRKLVTYAQQTEEFTDREREACVARLEIVLSALEQQGGSEPGDKFVLRAAIDKVQRGLHNELTPDEITALQECRQQIARKPNPSSSEIRLNALIESVHWQLHRER